jgi:amino acid adenylation domain-containing protein
MPEPTPDARAWGLPPPVHMLFRRQAVARPGAMALVQGARSLCYGELERASNRLAHALARRGVGPGLAVAVSLERSPEMVIALLGILKAGAAYLPLDPSYPAERLSAMLRQVPAPLALVDERGASQLAALGPELLLLTRDFSRQSAPEDEAAPPPVNVTAQDLAYIMFTSGSTGEPKAAAIQHGSIVNLVVDTDYVSPRPEDCFFQYAPISFDAATFEIWACLLNGARLLLAPRGLFSADELGQLLQEGGVTVLWLTAPLFHAQVSEALPSLRGVHTMLSGGDVLSVPHVQALLSAQPSCRLVNGYGPTETTTFACCHTVVPGEDLSAGVPIGKPIRGVTVRIVDTTGARAHPGQPGELWIGGAGVARGYYGRPFLTAERFVPDPDASGQTMYKSGDLVGQRPDGVLMFLGRIDNQLKIRGHRVEPSEIEAALLGHPGIRQVAVVARAADTQKRLVAFFVPAPGVSPPGPELRRFLSERLPSFMVPTLYIALPALPLTPSGKLDRKALPTPDWTRRESYAPKR